MSSVEGGAVVGDEVEIDVTFRSPPAEPFSMTAAEAAHEEEASERRGTRRAARRCERGSGERCVAVIALKECLGSTSYGVRRRRRFVGSIALSVGLKEEGTERLCSSPSRLRSSRPELTLHTPRNHALPTTHYPLYPPSFNTPHHPTISPYPLSPTSPY